MASPIVARSTDLEDRFDLCVGPFGPTISDPLSSGLDVSNSLLGHGGFDQVLQGLWLLADEQLVVVSR
jgi:hypothetical protein